MQNMFSARPGGVAQTETASTAAIMRQARRGIRRNLWLIIGSGLLLFALTLVYTATRTETYLARAAVLIDPRMSSGIGSEAQAGAVFLADALVVDSEIEVLRSERILRRVARDLPADTETPPDPVEEEAEGGPLDFLEVPLARLRALLPGEGEPEAEETDEDLVEQSELAEQVAWLQRTLTVEREGSTFVIALSFRDEDPVLAASIVNAVAKEYLDLQAEDQIERASRASDWLSEQLRRLSTQLAEAERDANQYRIENDLPSSGVKSRAELELTEVDREIISTRSIIRSAQSDLQSIEIDLERLQQPQEIGGLATAAFDDSNVASLQEQLRSAQDSGGSLNSIVSVIQRELLRLRENRQAVIESTEAGLQSLIQERSSLQQELNRMQSANIPLDTIERRIQSLQDQYTILSTQLQQSEGVDRFVSASARLIDEAVPPAKPEGSGGAKLIVAGLMGGLILGTGLAFLREQFDDRLRGPDDLVALGLPFTAPLPTRGRRHVSGLPEPIAHTLEGANRGALAQAGRYFAGGAASPELYVQGLRGAAALLQDETTGYRGGILITGPGDAAEDARSELSGNLASFLSQRGAQVLLVDADTGTLNLTRAVERLGLTHDKIETPHAAPLRLTRLSPELIVVTADATPQPWDPAAHTAAIRSLIGSGLEGVDAVVIDGGPLNGALGELSSLSAVEHVLLALPSGRISASALGGTLRQRPQIAGKISGTCLTRVRTRDYRKHDSGTA